MAKEKLAEELEVLEALKNIDFIENMYKDQLSGMENSKKKNESKTVNKCIIASVITVITVIVGAEAFFQMRQDMDSNGKIVASLIAALAAILLVVSMLLVYKAVREILNLLFHKGDLVLFKAKQGEYTSMKMEKFHGDAELIKLKELKVKVEKYRTIDYVYKAEAYKFEEVRHEDFRQAVDSYKIIIWLIELIVITLIAFLISRSMT